MTRPAVRGGCHATCGIRRKCFARERGAAATAVTHIMRCLCTCEALRLQLLHQPQPQLLQGAGGWGGGGMARVMIAGGCGALLICFNLF